MNVSTTTASAVAKSISKATIRAAPSQTMNIATRSTARTSIGFVSARGFALSSRDLTTNRPANKALVAVRSFSSSSSPTTTDGKELATATEEKSLQIPINFDVASKITGEESQIVEISLTPNQTLRAESGAMLYMTSNIQMETTTGGGLSAGFKRMLTGQNLMVSDFTYHGEEGTSGTVALGTDFPSKILRLSLDEYNNKIICQKGAYLAGSSTVDIEMAFAKKFTTGFFGGEGFVLQSLSGEGDVFVKAGGTLVRKELKAGETLRVSSGCIVAFTESVDYDVQMMPGFKNVLFGGEGLFVTTLTGPGTIWLQGMPPDRMISEIIRRVPAGGGIGLGVPIGMGGGGGSEGEAVDEAGEGEAGEGDGESAEDMVAATDAAVDADRQATVASSGLGDIGNDTASIDVDADSPSALFGDAAAEETTQSTAATSSSSGDFDDFNDTTSFSTEDDTTNVDFGDDVTDQQQFDDFAQEEDTTTFSTFEDEMQQGEEDVFDTGSDDMGGGDDGDGTGIGDILKSIWDFMSDDD